MRQLIQQKLSDIERENDVCILYACESGSRAWGFESPDSDYDIRFIYVRPLDWYLTFNVERKRDVLGPFVDGDLDLMGWDLRKALYLFYKANGSLMDWLFSPIVYRELGPVAWQLRELAGDVDLTPLYCHYIGLANKHVIRYISKESPTLKRYLYTVRGILSASYVKRTGRVPPVRFDALVEAEADEELKHHIKVLLARKKTTVEEHYQSDLEENYKVIRAFIEKNLAANFPQEYRKDTQAKKALVEHLNDVFRNAVKEQERWK